ncbi:MAG TPA: putative lipid II flippase FtsW [Candidatus Competibacteraceae bacterium]|nr:putative lipid II flippase FtsW [Candidatus Competibacteraceae bacterium]
MPRGATAVMPKESIRLPQLDRWLLFAALALLTLGLLMVASASMPLAYSHTHQPFFYLIRQAAYVGAGLLFAALAIQIPIETWWRQAPVLLLTAIGLLLLVLMPGIGREVNGSTRWLSLGVVNVQVSEAAKLFALIYLASYLQRHGAALCSSTMAMIRPLLVLGLLAVLLLLEPDFGTAVVMLATALGMLFLAGVNVWRFAALQGLVISAMAVLLYSSHYRRARLISFLDPWADPLKSGFQLTQSLIAIGRGELFGVGLGASVQKLFYLPESYTDFLFAILAEELGLLGVLTVVALYVIIIWRAFAIAARAERLEQRFASYLAYGIGLWFGIQSLFNMGVNMGVLPTKGLTLPLMSYGGSSVVVMCVALAILLRIDQEIRLAETPDATAAAASGPEWLPALLAKVSWR